MQSGSRSNIFQPLGTLSTSETEKGLGAGQRQDDIANAGRAKKPSSTSLLQLGPSSSEEILLT